MGQQKTVSFYQRYLRRWRCLPLVVFREVQFTGGSPDTAYWNTHISMTLSLCKYISYNHSFSDSIWGELLGEEPWMQWLSTLWQTCEPKRTGIILEEAWMTWQQEHGMFWGEHGTIFMVCREQNITHLLTSRWYFLGGTGTLSAPWPCMTWLGVT